METMELTLIKGNITELDVKVNVIVNSTREDLELNHGEVSSAILASAGNTIQQECKDKYKNGIKLGEIAVTSGGKLHCDKIYHTVLPNWQNNGPQVLENVIMACLEKAKGEGYEFIAFPALGTGTLKYPVGDVTKIFFETIIKFQEKSPGPLQKVILIAFHSNDDVIKAFENERLEKVFETRIKIESRMETTIRIALLRTSEQH
ncbi:macro domain-containing protein mll7730-like [Gigantopelta aegis]|uniref:macro domain-containing protein mll7730-like n=1 Tax=Gigantopelta aegis TaxID=1735272 RepID=UPI001B88C05F|nr:macro domain-containing protein mll7730-like [Gigantopelta aegis]XP_041369468.1 macro domain-containing protein mll7730-like [Gigantopelta aegis]